MKVNFKYFHAENFGKFQTPIEHELGKRVIVSGANGVGKSTIKRMFQYILGAKDENGKEISGIRPHDENGVDIDGLTTIAELTVSVDGMENTLKRTCFQEKNRQGEYTGKDNLQYFVDDVKKGTKKAYEEFVGGFLPNMVCISAQEFLSKDTSGRRAMLEVFSEHDTDSIIDENPDFEPLRAKLKANTVADLKKACRDKIKTQTKERDAYPARIDELEKQKADIDVAELELLKNSLNEQIAENKEKQADISKQFEEYDKQSKDILDLQFELSDLERRANEELEKQRRELINEEYDLCHRADREKSDIGYKKTQINNCERHIEDLTKELEDLRAEYTQKSGMEFDENELTCQMCGQPYPQEKAVGIRMNFHNKKNDILHGISERGNKVKEDLQSEKENLEKDKKTLETLEKGLSEKEERIEKVRVKMRELPQSIDISDREDVKAIKQQIAEKEQAMNKANSGAEIRKQLQDECEELQSQLAEANGKLALAQKNIEIDERISDLRSQQRKLSQDIADIERELSILVSFEREKARLLEEDLNKNCQYIRFKMSELHQNGDLKDICKIMVDGEDFDRNLNHGAKILAQIDICLMFQKFYGICLPIIVDDCESLDEWRIPKIENQLILLRRTDDKELRIETIG